MNIPNLHRIIVEDDAPSCIVWTGLAPVLGWEESKGSADCVRGTMKAAPVLGWEGGAYPNKGAKVE